MPLMFGRLPRTFDPRIPHLSALIAGKVLPPPRPEVHYAKGMPADLGMMLNDRLGDCTCAALYHAVQVWSFNAGGFETDPDQNVLKTYEEACGYDPRDSTTDRGGVEQEVLKYWVRRGIPVGTKGARNHLLSLVEADVRNVDDIKRVIDWCGVAYIGFEVPRFLMDNGVPQVWDITEGDATIESGHAVVLPGYDADTVDVVSWGRLYRMTWRFFSRFTDEAYGLANKFWIAETGKTPLGLTVEQLQDQMRALKK